MNISLLSLLYYSAVQSSSRRIPEKYSGMYLLNQEKTFTFENLQDVIIKKDNKMFLNLSECDELVLKTNSNEDPVIARQDNQIKITFKKQNNQVDLHFSTNSSDSSIKLNLDNNAEILINLNPLGLFTIEDIQEYKMNGYVVEHDISD